jgi:L-iditol 2-dehydrogenase
MCDLWKNTVTTAGFIPSGGGFAEYIKVPEVIAEKGITRIPSDTDFETATFLEPVNCGLKAVKRAQIKENDFVVVFGQGPAGILLTQLSSLHGAKVIAVDLIDYRLEKAVNVFGAVEGINAGKQDVAEEIKKITGGHGADTAITAVPNVKVIEQALGCVRKGGKFLMFAECDRDARITLDPNILYTAEIILLGSYSSSVKLQHEVEEIVFKKKIKLKEMVSHRFSLEEFPKALELALNPGRQEVLKIMIKPNI